MKSRYLFGLFLIVGILVASGCVKKEPEPFLKTLQILDIRPSSGTTFLCNGELDNIDVDLFTEVENYKESSGLACYYIINGVRHPEKDSYVTNLGRDTSTNIIADKSRSINNVQVCCSADIFKTEKCISKDYSC